MQKLVKFLVTSTTGEEDFEVEENQNEGAVEFVVKMPKETIGLLIGKQGRVIKAIRNILKIRATLEKVRVNISVEEK